MAQMIATVALVVADYDEALNWYTQKLRFEVEIDADLGGGRRWIAVRPPSGAKGPRGARIVLARADGGAQEARIGDQTGGRVGFFLETDDFARDHAAMLAAGVQFNEEPRHEPYGTVAVFEDLYGNKWDLLEPK